MQSGGICQRRGQCREPSRRPSACAEPGESVLGGWLRQTVLIGVNRQFKTVREVQFGKDGGEMMADGGLTDRQTWSDVLVPEPLPDQRDHLALTLREPGDVGVFGRRLGGGWWPGQIPEHAGN